MAAAVHTTHKAWIDGVDLRLDDFRAQVLRTTDPADYPLASDVRSNVLFYSSATVATADRRALQSALIRAFADYYANDALAVVCQAWLGPRYQVTSQVNVVNPGGKQQVPHRDYHLGFVPDEHLVDYPAHLHRTSPVLTLQGAVAHCDMPVESGPTMLLPFSQRFEGGYIAFK